MKKPSVKMLGYTDPRGFEYAVVDIDLLFPDAENPRIPVQESSLDSVLALQAKDPNGLFALAKDIVAMSGTNPSELLNVSREGAAFTVREGNRRVAARRLLRNPEVLRGQVTKAELERWTRLAAQSDAKRLPTEMVVVISDDHGEWVDRRHLGPQGGIGVQQWDPEAKARRAMHRKDIKHRTLMLLDALKASNKERFEPLLPPERTFTTLERVLDSSVASAHLGVDVDENGNVRLTRGERSLQLIEEVLRDLRKAGKEKLTSRTIHDKEAIIQYLDALDARVDGDVDEAPITLASGTAGRTPSRTKQASRGTSRPKDVLTQFAKPTEPRPERLQYELRQLRRAGLPNAAIVVTRVLLEITADHYAKTQELSWAGDRNVEIEEEVKSFQRQLSLADISASKSIREALKFASAKPMSLGKKLELVIRDLIDKKQLDAREGAAKIRELRDKQIVDLLNDAVHRLQNVPNMDRVDHILEVIRPVYNAMVAS
jgi:hypothetical protein